MTRAADSQTRTIASEPSGEERSGLGAAPAWRARWFPWAALGLAVLALALRLYRYQSVYEVHIDEAAYVDVSASIAHGRGLTIFGGPFHLHPPAYFILLAAIQRALGLDDSGRMALIDALRPVGAVLGAVTCLLVVLIVRRAAGVAPALIAGVALAVDPFANRWDSRVFLEAPAMALAATAAYLLVRAASSPDDGPPRLAVLTGLAVGGSVLTKEPYAFVSALPVLILLATGWGVSRRYSATVLAVAIGTYVTYVVVILTTGQLDDWWADKSSGVARLVGLQHTTGFNAAGAESLSGRLAVNLANYGASYALVGLGLLCAVLIVATTRHWRPGGRALVAGRTTAERLRPSAGLVVAAWALCAGSYVAYAVLLGTLEEQTFYLLLAPSVAAAGVALGWVPMVRPSNRGIALVAVVGVLVGQGVGWVRVHQRADDGYRQLSSWIGETLPPGTRVAVTEGTAQFLLEGVEITEAATVAEWVAQDVDFVLVSTELVTRGYGLATPETLATLEHDHAVAFTAYGRTLGELRLYDVRSLTGGTSDAEWPPTSELGG